MASLLAAAGCGEDGGRPAATGGPPSVTIGGRTWTVELATTRAARYRGLSGRESLAGGGGMLFIYPRARVREFCMRGCLIPLDIAFIGPDMRVVAMHTMAVEPGGAGRVPYGSGVAAQFVLEVAAGELEWAGVQIGDRAAFSEAVGDPAKAEDGP
jgi:hypothetical protein